MQTLPTCFFVAGNAVIVESTYGVSKHLPRDQREQRFIEKVRGILVRGGRVLLPVVALGRAQVRSNVCLLKLTWVLGHAAIVIHIARNLH